ncbi:cytidine deaminase-like [Ruditapes philippinarum]|uniref:cytidine deaminase-like n=1 Tax=Ruditapes philippinarum TaxID=129788 RepID=UPI00295C2AD7|nr:cytidine deaminase-like [Ruditapes philippinarum]XP_060593924.1 cytidine deaminase-like [Ruditapes philippinarum]
MDVSTLDGKLQELIKAADKVKENAYCPYSNFRVGAAVLCADGSIYAGCNVENASYGVSVCAERNAVMKAVTEGNKSFKALAVCCDVKGEFTGPCGICRQVLSEFNMDLEIYLTKPDMTYQKVIFRDLYPLSFTRHSLEEEKI